MAGQLRAPLINLDPLAEGASSIRSPLIISEPAAEGSPNLRGNFLINEPLAEGFRNLRCGLFFLEALVPVDPEGHVSTELFPGSLGSPASLPGLAFSLHKKPKFATLKHQAASGVSARQALRQYPIWEFELTYEFLRDNVTNEFKTLCGFFLSRQGGFDTFLFKDPDDYLVQNGALGLADGATTKFAFKRTMGGFAEKIGQVDLAQTISIYGSLAQAGSIPNTGPYTITTANAAAFVADLGVKKAGVPMVPVASAPAPGQYSVSAGVYTFNAADHGAAVSISYRYLIAPAAYAVTLPNLLIFGSAPAAGTTISADFQFYFNCCFQEDTADFEKFADKFWAASQIVLETVPQ